MDLEAWEKAMLLLSLVNGMAGAASVALAVMALRIIRRQKPAKTKRPQARHRSTTKKPGKALMLHRDSERILGHETPSDVINVRRIRRSPTLTQGARRDYFNR